MSIQTKVDVINHIYDYKTEKDTHHNRLWIAIAEEPVSEKELIKYAESIEKVIIIYKKDTKGIDISNFVDRG